VADVRIARNGPGIVEAEQEPMPKPSRRAVMSVRAIADLLRRHHTDLAIVLVLALLLGAVWTVSRRIAAQAESQGRESAFAEARNLTRMLTLQWSATLQRIDALQGLARLVSAAHLAGAPDEPDELAELRRAAALSGSNVMQVGAMNAAGDLIWSTLPMPPTQVNLARREHYLAIARDGLDRIVGRPVQGAVSGRWTIQFAEAMRHADGTLRAITVVSLDAGLVETLARELGIAEHGVISVVRSDGLVLARSPAQGVGEQVRPADALWRVAIQAGAIERLVNGPLDGVPRFYALRRIAGSDMVVVLGLDEAGQLAPVRSAIRQVHQWAAALGLALVGCAVAASQGIRRQRSLTRERQRTRDLAQREALLLQLAERATDVISLLDAGWRNIFVSPAVGALLGLDPQRMIGAAFITPVLPADAPAVAAALAALARDGGAQRFAFRARHEDGGFRWLETEMVAVGINDASAGTGCRYVAISRDITARQQAEAEFAELNRTLEVRVHAEVAAREEAQARAAHAERMQALGQLAGGIAHDFNNVLQAVAGATSLIERRPADEAGVRRLARIALEASDRGASITRRLLAFGHRADLRAEALDANAVLRDLREILVHTLGAAIEVQIRPGAGLAPLLADKGQLETALVNLATNARDAMPNGGRLILSAETDIVTADGPAHHAGLTPGRFVRLTVADTGVGMDALTLARASEPFFTTKGVGVGTGLGLPMVRGFAEQSGGALCIDSSPGRGTTVTLWLPESLPVAPAVPAAPVPAPAVRFGDPTGLGLVLVVDDEDLVREMITEHLEDVGYRVLTAANGSEALALLAAGEAVDVLVTDLSMPGLDGLAVIRAAQERRPGLPAVLLTGYAGDGAALAVGGIVTGSFSLLRKPVRGVQLVDRIQTLLGARARK
jgi:PAS domain S-box-containing protein